MSLPPPVSVVVPTYNRAASVVRAVRSVLAQTFGDFEVIVVDDGSSDGTEAAVEGLADPRVRFVSQGNAGPSAARNRGASEAGGRLLVFLDSDDVAMPGWLHAHVGAASDADVRLTRSGYIDLDRNGTVRRVVFARPPSDVGHTQGTFIPGTFAIERALFDGIGGYEPALRFGENTELAVRVLRALQDAPATAWRTVVLPRLLIRRQWSDRAAKYDDLKSATARFEIERHAAFLRSHRDSWSVRQSIVGVALAREGDLPAARRAFAAALRATPWRPRGAARLLAACLPPLAHRVWPARTEALPGTTEAEAVLTAGASGPGSPPRPAALHARPGEPTVAVIEAHDARDAAPGCADLLVFRQSGRPLAGAMVDALVGAAGRFDLVTLPAPAGRRPHLTLPGVPVVDGGACAVWSDLLDALGGWDLRAGPLAGAELAWRAALAGYAVGEVDAEPLPAAVNPRELGAADARLAAAYGPAGLRRADAVGGPLRVAARTIARLRG